jgi:Patatin-like phospholipase
LNLLFIHFDLVLKGARTATYLIVRKQLPSIPYTKHEPAGSLNIYDHIADDSKDRGLIHPDENITVHLGITMAGAVSGGAYIAGVMDYLMETLEMWEKLRQENIAVLRKSDKLDEAVKNKDYDPNVPMHSVIIDVIGGASAGSISAVLTALSLFHEMKPEEDKKERYKSKTFLYDAWVNLAEDRKDSDSTFAQMLNTDDLISTLQEKESNISKTAHNSDKATASPDVPNVNNKDTQKFDGIISLLNSKPLHDVKRRILESWSAQSIEENQINRKNLPYVSSNLNLVLTLTSLRGVPIKFSLSPHEKIDNADSAEQKDKPWHLMNLHRVLANFQMSDGSDNLDENYIPLDTCNFSNVETAFNFALASGAFPIGLPPAYIDGLKPEYIKLQAESLYGLNKNDATLKDHIEIPDEEFKDGNFNLFAVDGGVMNNDPFGEVGKLMEHKRSNAVRAEPVQQQEAAHLTANIFIDPFPNIYIKGKNYLQPKNILQVAGQLIAALLGQSRIKGEHVLSKFIRSGNYGMIFPSYSKGCEAIKQNPLATGGVEGFAGLISRNLREFDYQLGRRNCQGFLQKHFSMNKSDPVSVKNSNRDSTLDISDEVQQKKLNKFFSRWGSEKYENMRSFFAIQESNNNTIIKKGQFISDSDPIKTTHEFRIPIIPVFDVDDNTKSLVKPIRETIDEKLWYITSDELNALKKPIRSRVRRTLQVATKSYLRAKNNDPEKNQLFFFSFPFLLILICLSALVVIYVYCVNPLLVLGFLALLGLMSFLLIRYLISKSSKYILKNILGALRDRKQIKEQD